MTLFPRERVATSGEPCTIIGQAGRLVYIPTKNFDGVTKRTIKHSVQYNDNRDLQLVITQMNFCFT